MKKLIFGLLGIIAFISSSNIYAAEEPYEKETSEEQVSENTDDDSYIEDLIENYIMDTIGGGNGMTS